MTTEQIKNTELTSQDIVSRNVDVFATETSLAVAKDIQGLRAIFEEVGSKSDVKSTLKLSFTLTRLRPGFIYDRVIGHFS